MAISTVSFNNTPQARDDLYLNSNLTEDRVGGTFIIDVMANDLGGNAKKLYSIDDGVENEGSATSADLLTKDVAGVGSKSLWGANIAITTDGKVSYDPSGWSSAFRDKLGHLGDGESFKDSFTYAIQLGNGTLSWATVYVQIAGSNDAPVIELIGTDSASACLAETNAGLAISGTLTVTDADTSDSVSSAVTSVGVVGNAGTLTNDDLLAMLSVPTGPISADSGETHNLTWNFNSGAQAFNFLGAGQTLVLTYTITSTDTHSASDTQTVTVTIKGTNDAPTVTSGATADAIDENTTADTIVYTATASDPDAGDSITWSLTGTDADLLTIDSGGNVRLKAPADYEVKSSYSFNVVATDSGNLSDAQAVTLNINDVNEAPTAVSLLSTTMAINENVTVGAGIKVGDIAVTDDALGTNVLSLSGADAGSFTIIGNALYYTGAAPDFESKSSYSVTVDVDDASVGGTPDASQNFTLNINDVNEAPTAVSLLNTTTAIDENVTVGAGIKVADIAVTDDALGTNVLSLSGADAASFTIIGNALYYTGASPDFESQSSYSVTVDVDDSTVGGTPDASQNFTLNINDVNEAPTAVSLLNTTTAINENVSVGAGIKVADIAIIDDALGTNVLSLSGADAASFTIIGNALYYTGASPNFENKNSYAVTVNVNDASVGGNPDASQNFTLNINDVNEAPANSNPTDLHLNAFDANLNANNVQIGSFSTTDPDGTGTFSYSIIGGNAAGHFAVAGNILSVTGGSKLTDLAGQEFNLDVQVTDGGTPLGSYHEVIHLQIGTTGDNGSLGNASGEDVIYGNGGVDTLYGLTGDDALFGNDGNDTLFGGDGSDLLNGGAGSDTLVGGLGADTLTGGQNSDTFRFDLISEAADTVTDFNTSSTGDKLDIHDLISYADASPTLNEAITGGYVNLVSANGGADTIVQVDADGAAGGANFVTIVTLQGVAHATAATTLADNVILTP